MGYLPSFWFGWDRHKELLREASRERQAGLRRTREAAGKGPPTDTAAGWPDVRRGLVEDASRIADLLERRGIPRWVAFEGRFIVAERDGRIVAVLRFRQETELLHLGLLVAAIARVDEDPLAAALYAYARTAARELGAGGVRAVTGRHQAHLARAGYRLRKEGWRLDLDRG